MLRKVPARRGRSTPFRERNPVVIGAVGLAVIAAMLLLAFNIDKLPLLAGQSQSAALSEAGGLKAGDDVRIAGVKVGKVTAVDLEGSHVRVDFRVGRSTELGSQTSATVRIKTILGQKFLALEPAGKGDLTRQIPLSRTTPAYDVVEAFSDLATTTEDIDTGQLATALDTVANTFRDSPENVRTAIDGLGRLSRTVASRDAQLRELLQHANGVTGVLADRNKELVSLLTDGDLLLQELRKRRADIHTLLVSTVTLSQQLTGLVRENRAAIGPALANLKNVLATLEANQANLDRSIRLVAPFVRVFANTTGNGRWFDTYIQNLVPVPGGPGSPS
ncbi:MAG: phospholipid/cholesterol/gamma-HCH transport system substrate-binding protein [Actinomycetota bacterium]|jgi:phospholipid/cholesterol/gamma-HCH transport system substrate-binding protein|nr:phospholipid/cholesterol/gamma-HCH transport system substrate-binding protein [Actinomycetota bacterium]